MLKKLTRLFKGEAPSAMETHIPAESLGIDVSRISSAAIKVIETLQDEGWQAYLVGGGVRDLLLGETPKDFDVATDATPEKVNSIFRRSRIIGRRFKIVHVRMGRELIEVTTFRGSHEQNTGRNASQSEKGVLLRDNVYGDLESDAKRRDFTVNALYFDPSSNQVIDFCNGIRDIESRTIRMIGDPQARYKEDPVRMLRAVRFKCKLDFEIEKSAAQAILDHADYLKEIPPARLFEEVLKLFLSGKAKSVLSALHNFKLLTHLFPGADKALASDDELIKRFLLQSAENTDARIGTGKRVTPAFIFAAFLWPSLQEEMRQQKEQSPKTSAQDLLFRSAESVMYEQQRKTAIPKRFQIPMKEIWNLQQRLVHRDGRRAFASLEHKRFRAAYDFVLLREQAGENLNGLGAWWTEFQFADKDRQMAMLIKPKKGGKRRPRNRNQNRGTNQNNIDQNNTPNSS